MKANEFRIGNLINRPDLGDGHLRTESILAIYERVKTTGPVPTILDFKDIEPVPITKEWMTRLGFAPVREGKWEHGTMPLEIYWNERMRFYYGNAVGISLDYVHQLQNLYFALTGEELILSPPLGK